MKIFICICRSNTWDSNTKSSGWYQISVRFFHWVTLQYPLHTESPCFHWVSGRLFFFFFFFNFYCYSITVVCLFSPSLHPTPAKPTSLPHLHPPASFCPCVLYSSSWKPFPPLPPPNSPLAIVRLFLISMPLVIFCLLFSSIDYVPAKGEIIWYLSLTSWLISLA